MTSNAIVKDTLYKLRKNGRVVVYNPRGEKFFMEYKKGDIYVKYSTETSKTPLTEVNLPTAILLGMYLFESVFTKREVARKTKYANYKPARPELLAKKG